MNSVDEITQESLTIQSQINTTNSQSNVLSTYNYIFEFLQQLQDASQVEKQYNKYISELKLLLIDEKQGQFSINTQKLEELQQGAQQLIEMKQKYEEYQKQYGFQTVEEFQDQIQQELVDLKSIQIQQAELCQSEMQVNLQDLKYDDQLQDLSQKVLNEFDDYTMILQRINLFLNDVIDNFKQCVFNQFVLTANKLSYSLQDLITYMKNTLHINLEKVYLLLQSMPENTELTQLTPQEFQLQITRQRNMLPEALYDTYMQIPQNLFQAIEKLLEQVQLQQQEHEITRTQLLDNYDVKVSQIKQHIDQLEQVDFNELQEAEFHYTEFLNYLQKLLQKGYPRYELMISIIEDKLNEYLNLIDKMQELYQTLLKCIQLCKKCFPEKKENNNQQKQTEQDKSIQFLVKQIQINILNQNIAIRKQFEKFTQDQPEENQSIKEIITNLEAIDIKQLADNCKQTVQQLYQQKAEQEKKLKETKKTEASTIKLSQVQSTFYQPTYQIYAQEIPTKCVVPSSIDYNNEEQQKFLSGLLMAFRTPQLAQLCDPSGKLLYPTRYKVHKFFDCLAYTNKSGKFVPLRFNSLQEVTTKTVKTIKYGVRLQPKFGQEMNFSFSDEITRDRFYCTVKTLMKFQNKIDVIIAMVYQ